MIQGCDFALYGAAVWNVDEGILGGREDVTGNDDIGPAEVDGAVAVGNRVRLVKNVDAFVVVKFSPAAFHKSVRWPAFSGQSARLPGGRIHAVLDILMGDDLGAA